MWRMGERNPTKFRGLGSSVVLVYDSGLLFSTLPPLAAGEANLRVP